MLKSLSEEWERFEALVLPKDAPPVQRQEMRRAFYASAQVLLSQFMDIGEDEIDEDDGVKHLESLQAELNVFYLKMKQGVDGY